ncbi:MAG: hypothetical protein HND55_14295 [Pseudomonadota bacterium]|nr:MAG: hypothetical protein HND55_14295 [Pseudomonadota bacterium]
MSLAKRTTAVIMFCTVVVSSARADMVIDADMTGNWFVAGQPGHGLQLEIIDLSRAVVAWYTFDTEGQPLWLFGEGRIEGDTIVADLYRFEGTRFPPDFESDEIAGTKWGRIQIRRTGCDAAAFSYTPEEGAYLPAEFPLQRLTRIDGSRCGPEAPGQTVAWDLRHGNQGFEPLFVDYPEGGEDFYELAAGHRAMPAPWDDRGGIEISGNNHSDDLMMLLFRPLRGLTPGASYVIELEMQFASDVPSGCVGIGGSPGDSVFMRLGAAGQRPDTEIVDGMHRAILDLGQQASPGDDALGVGTLANGLDESLCADPDRPWRLKRVSTAGQALEVTADAEGRIWVYGLSDSGFEGTTIWYLTEFVVRLDELE